ncbi:unnamed protein product (macronuclear) [Paramecium tetraurelia]|uniref:Peptide chain release factor domain-containing protein n=1 Tax=Paramecium tetraurelia TaxID=5888 RepID=A0BRG9_PARTE|nr:uncharacterized protein GSPATT00031367001 [Paramecium tetraurelia]CAK61136.1 unnamed protein product [Paramecium tetraurelia]|eukprot:XP_001428534.1 hypothetical protein (macronuclear) [Paramecium tetraurelia strain d4-2]
MIKKFIFNCHLNRFQFSNTLNNISKTLYLINQRLGELNTEYETYQDQTIKGDMNEIKRRRMNELQPKIHIYKQIQASVSVIEDAKQLIGMGGSSDEISMLNEEIQSQIEYLKKYQDDALSQLIEEDEYDHIRQLNVEVRAGVGGSEGSLFAEDIIGMIQNYASLQNWDCRVISIQKDNQIGKGCKTGILQINGENVYQHLKCESGVHKVIRVPETEAKGRLHSSTASMIVLPKVTDSFHLSDKDLRYEYMRASGPGGQHVNKTESACRITHVPTGIQVVNMEDRSQERNKQRAYQILRDKLFAIHVQEKQERMAQTRKSQVTGSDRSDKIRTYNFPQERITDHRTNLTLYGMEKMLSGELLGEFIQKYQEKIHNAKLQDLLDELQNENKK